LWGFGPAWRVGSLQVTVHSADPGLEDFFQNDDQFGYCSLLRAQNIAVNSAEGYLQLHSLIGYLNILLVSEECYSPA
jgi:hypothetical protein